MPELADIFRLYGPQYREKYGASMLPSHLQAMEDIVNCRTPSMGGQLYFCDHCQELHYSYHSCKNRHCPKCQNDMTQDWIQKQRQLLLPVQHFLLTFTLPSTLRKITRSNQKTIYHILINSSASSLQKLAHDPRFIGGKLAMIGVLHTWDRKRGYHPHIHFLIPGAALSPDHSTWLPAREDFLLPVKPLSLIFRATFRDQLKKTPLYDSVPKETWKKDWVVHSEPVGSGIETMKYLAPYIFRVAISNNRLISIDNNEVSFRYQDSTTKQWNTLTLPALIFIRRFLQHLLPKAFIKVR